MHMITRYAGRSALLVTVAKIVRLGKMIGFQYDCRGIHLLCSFVDKDDSIEKFTDITQIEVVLCTSRASVGWLGWVRGCHVDLRQNIETFRGGVVGCSGQ